MDLIDRFAAAGAGLALVRRDLSAAIAELAVGEVFVAPVGERLALYRRIADAPFLVALGDPIAALVQAVSGSAGPVVMAEQRGATPYDRLQRALEQGGYGRPVIGERAVVDRAGGAPLYVRPGTTLFGEGLVIRPSRPAAYALRLVDDADDVTIHDVSIEGGGDARRRGNIEAAGIFARGPRTLSLTNVKLSGFSGYGIDCVSSQARGVDGVTITGARLERPGLGVSHPIIVRSGTGGLRGRNVVVEGCRLVGTDPARPEVEDYTPDNSYFADAITLQGMVGGRIADNEVRYSGSAGSTAARGCENIAIARNLFEMCYEPGVNAGSGLEIVHVEDVRGFAQGKPVVSPEALVTGGDVSAIVPDRGGPGGWLWLNRVQGGMFRPGHAVRQGGFRARIVPAANGEREEGRSIVYSGENFTVTDNVSRDTVIQANAAAYAFIRVRGRNLLANNSYASPRGLGRPTAFATNAHSVLEQRGNRWKGRGVERRDLNSGGRDHEWLSLGEAGDTLLASCATSADGTLKEATVIATCERIGRGTYAYTFDAPRPRADFAVSSDRTARVVERRADGFVVTVLEDGNPADRPHAIAVNI